MMQAARSKHCVCVAMCFSQLFNMMARKISSFDLSISVYMYAYAPMFVPRYTVAHIQQELFDQAKTTKP